MNDITKMNEVTFLQGKLAENLETQIEVNMDPNIIHDADHHIGKLLTTKQKILEEKIKILKKEMESV